MKRIDSKLNCALALALAAFLAGGQAIAADGGKGDKGERHEKGDKGQKGDKGDRDRRGDKDDKGDKGDRDRRGDRDDRGERRDDNQGRSRDGDDRSSHDSRRSNDQRREHFGDRHRTIARDYYRQEIGHGRCPPGLAKRNNGCVPPGLARQWSVGRPLPRQVIYYDVSPALVMQFDPPPQGYRYVRVASDILLIALGTGMVIDAIQDMGGL